MNWLQNYAFKTVSIYSIQISTPNNITRDVPKYEKNLIRLSLFDFIPRKALHLKVFSTVL